MVTETVPTAAPAEKPANVFLGRVVVPDPRDAAYRVRDRVPRRRLRAAGWQTRRWPMVRGETWHIQRKQDCVYHGIGHAHVISPTVRRGAFALLEPLYPWALDNDEFAGNADEGTSVRAGLEYCRLVAGTVERYDWCFSMDEVLGRLSADKTEGGGPLVVGTDFRAGMANLAGNERAKNWWEPTGALWGGHCYVFWELVLPNARSSAPLSKGYIKTGNSHRGNEVGRLTLDAAEYLLFGSSGEAAAITEAAVQRRAA